MRSQAKDDIADILLAIYGVPGLYSIGALILFALGNAMQNLISWALLFQIVGVLFIILEIITPIMAGERLLQNLEKKFRKFK